MGTVWIEKRKPCGRVRRTWSAEVLGADVWGDWFSVPDEGGVLLLPLADPWVAWFGADGGVRVDVATTVVAAAPVSSFVDLDVDVERHADGSVHMLDAADLLHRAPSYPRPWVELAWEAWHDVARDVGDRVEPFGTAPDLWLRRAARAARPSAGVLSA
ncbi:hypothetical protein BCE75_11178 [Isoptericola sp. CG 20/1183]|uniref:DUF402 domain-containing protein n=1 Tax=Isoptericola halotolerans TaxID=300560 RepID=A0ABX5EI76_9MICO|nr:MULTISPECIES: DUF402 domain-containing protein [Isoptericola]MCK0118531.1 DUF402 domain-containing protein [Isoptericola sp. S6320L]PRZ04157.1 hypothetical protein BCE75_11178 [Isoptericola sp. CG 20/1183]PRZ10018.1 hypothetical protein BCL65_101156 [Isoptericola halotolerans]